ncbi:CHAT domain-containing protein [Yinghuangia soli]|uniref:CHAT domain-containing protein n=1 Tax=Yinghuangia soli TaxID=2908204 RepID=A0AA41Q3Q2_9ACTN|nr:CHAT domain-containing protein [Yinghuangia soli]MCF2530980.1 CHAT domain-containing protein [Yinghuangia soli]
MRDEVLASGMARLDAISPEAGFAAALAPETTVVIQQLTALSDEDPLDGPVAFVLGNLLWLRFAAQDDGEDQRDAARAGMAFARAFAAGLSVEGIPEPLLPFVVELAADGPAAAVLRHVVQTGDREAASRAVYVWQEIVRHTSREEPEFAKRSADLFAAFECRYRGTGDPADLDHAIDAVRDAAEASRDDDPDRAMYLSNLGGALQMRYARSPKAADLDAAIDALHQSVAASPEGHPNRARSQSNLGIALAGRFQRTRHAADLDAAVEAVQQAVAAAADGDRDLPSYLSNVGTVLQTRYELTHDPADLDVVIDSAQAAVDTAAENDHYFSAYLLNLSNALQFRYEQGSDPDDLNRAVDAGQRAVDMVADAYFRYADHAANLSTVLRMRSEHTGSLADLDAAIGLAERAVGAVGPGHPRYARFQNILATALWVGFQRTFDEERLDAAGEAAYRAVEATPEGHPSRAIYLNTLAMVLRTRFDNRQEVALLLPSGSDFPANHPGNPLYSNPMRARRTRQDDMAALDTAIEAAQMAVAMTPEGHPHRAMYLNTLAMVQYERFEQLADTEALAAAVDAARAAVAAVPEGHPHNAAYLTTLGKALESRHEEDPDSGFLAEAVAAFATVARMETAPPRRRAVAARAAAEWAADSDPRAAAELAALAVELLSDVSPVQLRRSDRQLALGRFGGLAGEAAALALDDPSRPLPERARQAVQLLEAGRGVLLGQALDMRADLADLREVDSALAEEFTRLEGLLERVLGGRDAGPASSADGVPDRTATEPVDSEDPVGPTDPAERDPGLLAAKYEGVLRRIRALDGFADFALPPPFEELAAAASQGAVVLFSIDERRSDALVLTADGVEAVPLPGLGPDVLGEHVGEFHRALHDSQRRDDPAARVAAQRVLHDVLGWLWDVAVEPVLGHLGHASTPGPEQEWPRVWWVPGGALGLLPLHAAGHHADPADDADRRVLLDRVISSYAPTVRALSHTRRSPVPTVAEDALIVALPVTPELPGRPALRDLTHAGTEARNVQGHFPAHLLLQAAAESEAQAESAAESESESESGADSEPTRAAVLAHMPEFAVVHFACHGVTEGEDPSASRLFLQDGSLTVADLTRLRLDGARLAYLSACETATGHNRRLLDEAINLAFTFRLAGYRHVVGTLWKIDDEVSAEAADLFYGHLRTSTGSLDVDRSAAALHHTVRTLRGRYPAPGLWAAYLHTGP